MRHGMFRIALLAALVTTIVQATVSSADDEATVPVSFYNLKVVLDLNTDQQATALVDVCVDDEVDPRWRDLDAGEVTPAVELSKAPHDVAVYAAQPGATCAERLAATTPLSVSAIDLTNAPGARMWLLYPNRPARAEADFECNDTGPGQPGCVTANRYLVSDQEAPTCPADPTFANVTDFRNPVNLVVGVTGADGGSGEVAGSLAPTQFDSATGESTFESSTVTTNRPVPVAYAPTYTFPSEVPAVPPLVQPSFAVDPGRSGVYSLLYGGPVSDLGAPVPDNAEVKVGVLRIDATCETTATTSPGSASTTPASPVTQTAQVAGTSQTAAPVDTQQGASLTLTG